MSELSVMTFVCVYDMAFFVYHKLCCEYGLCHRQDTGIGESSDVDAAEDDYQPGKPIVLHINKFNISLMPDVATPQSDE